MTDPERLYRVRRWLRYAREDLALAERMTRSQDSEPRHICFFSQQAAEKGLKAVLIFCDIEFPYRHDLNALRNLVPPGWALKSKHPHLGSLTTWVTESRYPSIRPDPEMPDALAAFAQARAVLDSVLRDLSSHGFDANASE